MLRGFCLEFYVKLEIQKACIDGV